MGRLDLWLFRASFIVLFVPAMLVAIVSRRSFKREYVGLWQ